MAPGQHPLFCFIVLKDVYHPTERLQMGITISNLLKVIFLKGLICGLGYKHVTETVCQTAGRILTEIKDRLNVAKIVHRKQQLLLKVGLVYNTIYPPCLKLLGRSQ
jgi:hypothetical protein